MTYTEMEFKLVTHKYEKYKELKEMCMIPRLR